MAAAVYGGGTVAGGDILSCSSEPPAATSALCAPMTQGGELASYTPELHWAEWVGPARADAVLS